MFQALIIIIPATQKCFGLGEVDESLKREFTFLKVAIELLYKFDLRIFSYNF